MNVTELVEIIKDLGITFLTKDFDYNYYYSKVFKLACWFSYRLASVTVDYTLILSRDALYCCFVLVRIFLLVIFISFIKSLIPRYSFIHDSNSLSNAGRHIDRSMTPQAESTLNSSVGVQRPNFVAWKQFSDNLTTVRKILSGVENENSSIVENNSPNLSNSDISSVYRQLSWSQTQIDLESVKWLNQTLLTLWPSIKGLLNKLVIDDVLKPKKVQNLSNLRKTAIQQSKLSIYISSRRKLDFLRKIRSERSKGRHNNNGNNAFHILVYILKLITIYIKQIILDYVAFIIKRKASEKIESKEIDINIGHLLSQSNKSNKRRKTDATSWAGFDLNSSGRIKEKVISKKNAPKFRSAPAELEVCEKSRLILAHDGGASARRMARLRKQHYRLIKKFEKARDDIRKKEITIEEINLGGTTPTLSGIKYIDESNEFLGDTSRLNSHLIPSDNNNMRFICEFCYNTDKNFCMKFNSLPILERVKLNKFNVQVRLLITVNHTTTELNRELRIFETPDDILFPVINHVQVNLIDLPKVDWSLEKYSLKSKTKVRRSSSKQSATGLNNIRSNSIFSIWKAYLNPFHLINHSFFKYLIHSIAFLTLKWFRPFDIKIGDHFYIKTTC